MYIKNQSFSDEDTLIEMLFDFSLGKAAPLIEGLKAGIEQDLAANEAYQEFHASLTDEEDRLELEAEERLIRLAEALKERFDSFRTGNQRLFGIGAAGEELLYEIDLV